MDPSRRDLLAMTLFAAALPVPAYADLSSRAEARVNSRTTRIGAGEVAVVRTMTERIADILDELGGGHARPMAAAFLVNTVAPYLYADASESVRKDMLAAASDLVYLTGWMAMYEKAHGLGQRYYREALSLASEAGDHVTYCRTLRGMALQAANLHHAKLALELADSAAEAAPKAGPRLHASCPANKRKGLRSSATGDRHSHASRRRRRPLRGPTIVVTPSGVTTRPRITFTCPAFCTPWETFPVPSKPCRTPTVCGPRSRNKGGRTQTVCSPGVRCRSDILKPHASHGECSSTTTHISLPRGRMSTLRR